MDVNGKDGRAEGFALSRNRAKFARSVGNTGTDETPAVCKPRNYIGGTMEETINSLVEYCDSVSGAEHIDHLRCMQDVLSEALNVVTLMICGKLHREDGDICQAISAENRADFALSKLRKLQEAA